jgi:hypothetical protein
MDGAGPRRTGNGGRSDGLAECGAHARIRTGDLFLTKWYSVPGEFDPILGQPANFREDHLTTFAVDQSVPSCNDEREFFRIAIDNHKLTEVVQDPTKVVLCCRAKIP